MGNTLLAAEHLVRYWWAAQAAVGADVLDAACGVGFGTRILAEGGAASATGVDLSEAAVSAARQRAGELARFATADVAKLPLKTDSVDLVVCFETIEHVDHPERVIDEFRRVLRPEGALLISTPNRGVSPPGNPHHVHEYTSDELEAELRGAFANVSMRRQQSWFASMITGTEAELADPARRLDVEVRTDQAVPPGTETYAIGLAGDGPLPPLPHGAAFLASPHGPETIQEEIRRAHRELHLQRTRTEESEAEVEKLGRRLEETGQEHALAVQELDRTSSDLERAHRALKALQSSASWRLTRPVRGAKRLISSVRS